MNIRGTILSRIGWIYILTMVIGLGVLGKILYLQLVKGDEWKAKAEEMSQKKVIIPANRGNILDTFYNPISSTIPTYDLRMDPVSSGLDIEVYNNELSALARGLSDLFGDKTAWEYKKIIQDARRDSNRYVLLKKKISYLQAQKVRELPLFKLGQYKGGLILQPMSTRQQPYELLALRTIGYVQGGEGGRKVGLEGKFDKFLKGENGLRYEYRTSGNNWIPVSTQNFKEPQDGLDIVTTLNMNYQDVAEKALMDLLVEMKAHHGCAILMEVATGEIRAMANLTEKDGQYVEDYNYAVGERTEPGSTFKLPSLLAVLEAGYVELDDTINTFNGKFRIHDREVTDSHYGGFGIIDVRTVFEKSSNIGMGRIIDENFRNDPQEFIDRLYSMGLENPTGIEINGEPDPDIYGPDDDDERWSGVSLFTMAYGYGIALTPLQILTFYNAVANNGKMVAPRLVREIRSHSHLSKSFQTKIIKNSICSQKTIESARELLEGVVKRGTATNLETELYQIAGKTGTAIINRPGGYGQKGDRDYRASFAGYFPADNPMYSCIVVVANPKGQYYGNKVAGSVFLEIADKVFATDHRLHPSLASYSWESSDAAPVFLSGEVESGKTILKELGLDFGKRSSPEGYAAIHIQKDRAIFNQIEIAGGIVPDVTGMGLADALPLLENEGLKVNVRGYGKIVEQSLAAGEQIIKGQKIELILEHS